MGAAAGLRIALRLERRVARAVDGGVGGRAAAATSPWPRRRVRIVATSSTAQRVGLASVEVRVEDWAVGVSCERDVDVAAPLAVSGSGLYVGGCLRGRENVSFGVGDAGVTADGRPVDGARGDECAVAAAHAGAGIFAGGAEVHDPPLGAYAEDGDPHSGVATLPAWVAGPSPGFLAAAEARGTPAGAALHDGSLHLDAFGAAEPAQMVSGRCVFVAALDEVTIEGVAGEDVGPLLIIVHGRRRGGRAAGGARRIARGARRVWPAARAQ